MKNKTLVVIDIQKEYTTEGRPFRIESIGPSLSNAKIVLEKARAENWQIIHVQHLQEGDLFNHKSELSNFVAGFEPQGRELKVIKNNYSSYSAETFAEAMKTCADAKHEVVVIGYGSTMCCISTIIDGYHRGNKMVFVQDASNSKSGGGLSEANLHTSATHIISNFARVTSTSEFSA